MYFLHHSSAGLSETFSTWLFMVLLEIRTQVLKFVQEVLYLPSYLSSSVNEIISNK